MTLLCYNKSLTLNAVLLLWSLSLNPVHGFVCPLERHPSLSLNNIHNYHPKSHRINHNIFRLYMNANPDPFEILNIPQATTDKKVIKKAYRRMAMKYHPDVVINSDSTAEEKKRASDYFAQINAAYELLSGKGSNSAGSSSTSSRSSTSSSGYTPPHRRTSSYSYSNNNYKSWEDFMPKYEDDEKYDSNGDSFASIFSDLVTGMSSNQSGGIFKDLVEFLESNIDGFSNGNYNANDDTMQDLLQYGTMSEIKEELDDTDLLVQQLTKKYKDLISEKQSLETSSSDTASFTFRQQMEQEERLEEIKARAKVIDGYLQKAKARLLRLQTKYKELRNTKTSSNYDTSSYSSSSQSYRSTTNTSTSTDTNTNVNTNFNTNNNNNDNNKSNNDDSSKDEDGWKREGFGSSGRGRGRGSSRRRNVNTTSSTSANTSYGSSRPSTSSYSSSSSYTPSPSYSSSTRSSSPPPSPSPAPASQKTKDAATDYTNSITQSQVVPPHRRTSSYSKTINDSKKRLRELQVEDEFEKLKKELGM